MSFLVRTGDRRSTSRFCRPEVALQGDRVLAGRRPGPHGLEDLELTVRALLTALIFALLVAPVSAATLPFARVVVSAIPPMFEMEADPSGDRDARSGQ